MDQITENMVSSASNTKKELLFNLRIKYNFISYFYSSYLSSRVCVEQGAARDKFNKVLQNCGGCCAVLVRLSIMITSSFSCYRLTACLHSNLSLHLLLGGPRLLQLKNKKVKYRPRKWSS